MTEIETLYRECLEYKMRIEVCYKSIKDNYVDFRIEAYHNLKLSMGNVKKELQSVHDNATSSKRINEMFNSYKELLVKFMLYKQKIALLMDNSNTLISDSELEQMVRDQNTMMGFVTNINEKISENQVEELYKYVDDKTNKK
jgi:hypothetical protein